MCAWPVEKLGKVVTFKTGKLDSNAAVAGGAYPFFTCSQETYRTNTFAFDTECVLLGGNNANGIYPLKYFSGKFDAYQRTYIIRPIDTNRLSTRYLYYAMRPMLSELRSVSTGAATKFLTLTILNEIELKLPPAHVQARIVEILSAYDDLIENCQRRIKILEGMARAIYREWFVNFRYPGHEAVPLVASPLGPIPQGWVADKLGAVADISWGDTSTTKAAYVENGFAAYSASGLDGKLDHYDFDRLGIVLSAIGAQCGKTWLARDKWSCIKNTIRFWSKKENISTEFLYIATEGQDFWPRRGAAQPFISQGDAQNINIVIPDAKAMADFSSTVANMLKQVHLLESKSKNLRRTRDLLLPRLLSGQIDLSEAETVEADAA